MEEKVDGKTVTGDARVRRWTQKLLDLSLRNRLLNVRDGKQFIPLFCRDVCTLEDRLAESETVQLEQGDPEDVFLASTLTVEETRKRLTALYRQAKTDLEEGGVNTLFLAVGFLKWRPTPQDEKFLRAPVLLIPVRLVRKTLSDYRIARFDEETVANATLLELLRAEYGISVPGVDPLPSDDKGVDVAAVLQSFQSAVADQPGWEVIRTAALGQFSFGKFVMWKDLTSRMDELRKNPLVNHLVEGGGIFDDGVEVFPPEEVESKLVPVETFCPLSADSSQMTAVLYSALGKTFVLHGPPGTGKSQTITNLIAHNLAQGRRVLFVSEKKAALDVVHRRLAAVGLKPFCLELHSNKSGKADVLAQFKEALSVPDCTGPADWTTTAQHLAEARDGLNAYVRALHKVYPNGFTACDCFAHQIGISGSKPTAPLVDFPVLGQSRADYETRSRLVGELPNHWRGTSVEAVAALAPLKDVDWTPGIERQVAAAARDLAEAKKKGFFANLLAAFRNRAHVPFGAAYGLSAEGAERLAGGVAELRGVMNWRKAKAEAVRLGLGRLIAALEKGEVIPENLQTAFFGAYTTKMLDEVLAAEPALASFTGLNQDDRVKRFRELDARLAELAKGEVFARLAAKLPRRRMGECPAASELGILRRECEKKARQKPVRQLLAEIPSLASAIKPCFLMSPLSVAQYLPADAAPFDLVVFDEASQIPVWDAVGVLARGRQAVIVGDPKQMPPTSFFQKGESAADAEDEDVVEDMESILDECLAAGVHSAYLNWHYRSRHESLIAFSNHNYYEDRLNTFPCASVSPRLGVRFEFVPNGVYDRRASRTNRVEAQALVDYIFTRMKEPGYTPRSMGVVTFSQAQKELIEDLIDERREKEPALEAFFGEGGDEPFFVKNLENVQGDERDVILFSVGYAPGSDGKFAMNFGPLNRDGGERRLNVAVTRAKEQVVVFSSVHGSQIDLARTSAVGAAHLKSFLDFAEKGSPDSACGASRPAPSADAEFPSVVAETLRARGWGVDENVGCGQFRIDLAVRRKTGAGYLLAIECDGPAYAAQRTARDRDCLRASVLKGLGWHVTRLWSVDWAFDRTRAEESLVSLLDALVAHEAEEVDRKPPVAQPAKGTAALPTGVTALRARPVRAVKKTRSIDEIPPAELAAAMQEVTRDFGGCDRDTLYRETLKRFGLTVLNAKARAHLDAASARAFGYATRDITLSLLVGADCIMTNGGQMVGRNDQARFNRARVWAPLLFAAAAWAVVPAPAADGDGWPKIWTNFNWGGDLPAQFADMAAHGIEVVEVPVWNEAVCRQALALCRAHGLKAFGSTDEPSCNARPALRGKSFECAEFIGGCFRGRAIDRNVFTFPAAPQDILVEPPVYASGQPYTRRTADSNGVMRVTRHGHYFSHARPVRAEVVVPLKLFDGTQHLKIIPVEIEEAAPGQVPENDTAAGAMRASAEVAGRRLVRLRFDLTPYAAACLDKVGIAVYWSSDPARPAWRNGRGQMSVFSPATRDAAVHTVSFRLHRWCVANGGTFPSDVLIALRFGDECFNVTGWLDAPSASYPLFDYSASARAAFGRLAPPGLEMPRTWGCPEIYGAPAYGLFLYNYHRGCADLAAAAVAAARAIAPDVKVFRNTTRGEVWSYTNDHDGTGQELLAGVFDFIHGDPYPVRTGYNAETIPFDMGYLAGLARRYGKPLVPWVQAHAYSPCGLGHVTPDQLERMWRQHAVFAPAAIMYLGYGYGEHAHCTYTFPAGNPATWEKATELHRAFRAAPRAAAPVARLAVVRPYTVRALACDTGDGAVRNPADALLAAFVRAWSVDHGQAYDVFEVPPVESQDARAARSAALAHYAHVVSTAPGDRACVIGAGTAGRVYSHAQLVAFRQLCRAEITRAEGGFPCSTNVVFSAVP